MVNSKAILGDKFAQARQGRLLRRIVFFETVAVMSTYLVLFLATNSVLTRQSAVNAALLDRFQTVIDVQFLQETISDQQNIEDAYFRDRREAQFADLLARYAAADSALSAAADRIAAAGPLEAPRLAEEQRLIQDLVATQQDIRQTASDLFNRALILPEGGTFTPKRAALPNELTELEKSLRQQAQTWRGLILGDITRLNTQMVAYQRQRVTLLSVQLFLVVLIVLITAYAYVLPTFNRMLRQLITQNEQLRQIDALKTEFLSIASHQLRTPLSSLNWSIVLLGRQNPKSYTRQQKSLLDEAKRNVTALAQVVATLLNVSRIEQGKFRYNTAVTNLIPIIRQVAQNARAAGKPLDITVKLNLDREVMLARVDNVMFRQVIQNLVDNAVQYNRPGGTVWAATRSQGDHWAIEISDTGYGISRDDLKHLFTKFYRGDQARKIRPDGSGLGLYLARKIIAKHGGSIAVKSVVGAGASVTIVLPKTHSRHRASGA